jgi:hypothetical protein
MVWRQARQIVFTLESFRRSKRQAHARSTAVFVDEFDVGGFESAPDNI